MLSGSGWILRSSWIACLKVQHIDVLAPYSQRWDGCSSLTFSCVVSYFNGGLQLLCFRRGSQASCASCGLVSPKGVWCIWPPCCPAVALCLGFCFMLRLAAISTGLWLFPGSLLIHWVFAYVSVWTGTLFRVPDSEWFSSEPRAIVYFSKAPTIDLQFQLRTVQPLKPVSDLFEHKHISKSHNQP